MQTTKRTFIVTVVTEIMTHHMATRNQTLTGPQIREILLSGDAAAVWCERCSEPAHWCPEIRQYLPSEYVGKMIEEEGI